MFRKLKSVVVFLKIILVYYTKQLQHHKIDPGGVLGSIFAGYVPLASQNPYPIIVYSLANY